jgi:hypothetical protein
MLGAEKLSRERKLAGRRATIFKVMVVKLLRLFE